MMSGTGGKAFCAGGNLKGLYDSLNGKESKDKNLKQTFLATSYAVDYNLQKMKPFQISIWNGLVMGGGVGISQYAPIRIATDNTV